MDFTAPKQQIEYLSLESFDPLYSLEKSVDMEQSTDSIGLFPNPLDRLQRKNTPNPFPKVNPVPTQNLMRKSSCDILSQSGDHVSQADAKAATSRPTSTCSTASNAYEELQDPFDVPDLLKALERKRQQHAKAQAERLETQRKQEEEDEKYHRKHPVKEVTPPPSSSPRGGSNSPRGGSEGPRGLSDSPRAIPNLSRRYSRTSSYMQQGEVRFIIVTN
jgi:hypothetical protein